MKRLSFGQQFGSFEQWATECFRQIESATAEDIEAVVADFTVTGTLTELRTIDAGTATLAQVRDVLCTLISDIKKRGQKRTYA